MLAYTEELLDEKGATAAGFWERAVKFFRRHGDVLKCSVGPWNTTSGSGPVVWSSWSAPRSRRPSPRRASACGPHRA
jgi:hypothetical protein